MCAGISIVQILTHKPSTSQACLLSMSMKLYMWRGQALKNFAGMTDCASRLGVP